MAAGQQPGAGAPRPSGAAGRTGPSSANGAPAGPSAAAAAGAAGAAPQQPFWAGWEKLFHKHSSEIHTHATKFSRDISLQAKNFKMPKKWEMPVRVEMDLLNPQLETLRGGVKHVWTQLPVPVQQLLPYVAVGAGTGLAVYHLQQRRVKVERERTRRLRERADGLSRENEELHAKLLSDQQRFQSTGRSPNEVRMATAVANATQAAAAAAEAAARAATAATACLVVKGGGGGIALPPPKN